MKKEFTGNLQAFDEEQIYLEIKGFAGPFAIKRANIAKAQQHIEF
jgi:ribosome maturation factor RimP